MRYLMLVFSALSMSVQAAQCPQILPQVLSNPLVVGDGTAASCNATALQAALNQGGAISFNCGGAAEIVLDTALDVSLPTILDGSNLITLNGQNKTRILRSTASLTVQNLTFKSAKAPGDASAHFSERCGGAILARGAGNTLTVINSQFIGNSVTNTDENDIAGGAIYAFGLYEAVIAHSTFSSNTASNGGAIGGLASGIRLIDSQFISNRAIGQKASGPLRGHGGAINMDGVTNSQNPDSNKLLHICGSLFMNNQADNQGGALNSVFSDNKGSQAIIENSWFADNQTTNSDSGQGGAVFHMEDEHAGGTAEENFIIRDSSFSGNHTAKQGGAVWTLIAGKITISNSSFYNNRARDGSLGMGGALAVSQGETSIHNSTFANNYAWFHGAGIQAATAAVIRLGNNVFYQNASERDWANYHMNRAADADDGGNIQYPNIRFNQANTPADTLVTDSTQVADPLLQSFGDYGGAVPVSLPATASPAAQAGARPIAAAFSGIAVPSGSLDNATLSASLRVLPADFGSSGAIYVAALLPNGQWFASNGSAWLPWNGGSLPVFYQGELGSGTLPIFSAMDVRGLSGTQLLVGYGRDETDVLSGQYQVLYSLP